MIDILNVVTQRLPSRDNTKNACVRLIYTGGPVHRYLFITVEMLPVGEFIIDFNGTQMLQLLPNKQIKWSENGHTSVPRDKPYCGFMDELCPTTEPSK